MSASDSILRERPLKTSIDQLNFLFKIVPGLPKGYPEKEKKRWWNEQPGKRFKIGLIRSHDLDSLFTVINETFDVAKATKGNSKKNPVIPAAPKETKDAGFNTQNNAEEKELDVQPESYLTAKDFDRLYLGWIDDSDAGYDEKQKTIIKSTMKQLFRFIFGTKKIYKVNDFHTRLIIAYTDLEPVEKIPCDPPTGQTAIQRNLREHFRKSLQFRLDLVRKEVIGGTSVLGEQAIYVDDKKDLLLGLRDIINALDDKEASCIEYGEDSTMKSDVSFKAVSGDYDRLLRIFKALIMDRQKENPSFPSYDDFQTHLVKGNLTNSKKGKDLYEELLKLLDRATMKHAEELEAEIVRLSEMIELANKQHILHLELERLRCKKEKDGLPADVAAAAAIQKQLDDLKGKAATAAKEDGPKDDTLQGLLNRLALLLAGKPVTPAGKGEDTLEGLLAALKAVAPAPAPGAGNAGLQRQIDDLRAQLAAKPTDANIAALRAKPTVANLQTAQGERNAALAQVAALQGQLQEAAQAAAALDAAVQRADAADAALAALEAQQGQQGAADPDLANRLRAAEQERNDARAERDARQAELERAREAAAAAAAELAEARRVAQEAVREAAAREAAAVRRAEEAAAALLALQGQQGASAAELAEARQRATDAEAARAAAAAELAVATQRAEEAAQEAGELRTQAAETQAAADAAVAAAQREAREAQEALAAERAAAAALLEAQRQAAAATGENRARLQAEVARKEAALEAAQAALATQQADAAAALAAARAASVAEAEGLRAQIAALEGRADPAELQALQETIANLTAQLARRGEITPEALAQLNTDLAAALAALALLQGRLRAGAPGTAGVPGAVPGLPPAPPPGRPAGVPAAGEEEAGAAPAPLSSPQQRRLEKLACIERAERYRELIKKINTPELKQKLKGGEPLPGETLPELLHTYFTRINVDPKQFGQSQQQLEKDFPLVSINAPLLNVYIEWRKCSSTESAVAPPKVPESSHQLVGSTIGQTSEQRPATAKSATGPLQRVAEGTIAVGSSGSGIKVESLPAAGSKKEGGGKTKRESPLLSQDSFCETMLTLLLLHAQQAQGESFDLQNFLDKAAATLDDLGQCPIVLHTLNKLLDDAMEHNKENGKGITFVQLRSSPQDELQAIEKAFNNRFTEEEQDALESFTPQIVFSRPPESYTDVLGARPYMLNISAMDEDETPLLGLDEDPENPVVLDASERDMLTTGGVSLGGLLFLYLNCLRQLQESGNQPDLNSKCPALVPKRSKEMAKTPKAKLPRKRKAAKTKAKTINQKSE
jgi:hypothetical protein